MRAQKYDFGDSVSNSLEDMINSKNIFLWGKNPANTTIHTMAILNKGKEKREQNNSYRSNKYSKCKAWRHSCKN